MHVLMLPRFHAAFLFAVITPSPSRNGCTIASFVVVGDAFLGSNRRLGCTSQLFEPISGVAVPENKNPPNLEGIAHQQAFLFCVLGERVERKREYDNVLIDIGAIVQAMIDDKAG